MVTDTTETQQTPRQRRAARQAIRHPGRQLLIGLAALLVLYYLVYLIVGGTGGSSQVSVQRSGVTSTADSVDLSMRVVTVDPASRTMEALITPSPGGTYEGSRAGESAIPLRLEVVASGQPPFATTFAANSIIDPVSVQLPLVGGARSYPFDRPDGPFRVALINDQTGATVPVGVNVINASAPWKMTASATGENDQVRVVISPRRDYLTISLVIFTMLSIVLTTAIAVSNVGTALVRKRVEFSQVIWLSATVLAFPSLRNAMPGVPPLGITLDYLVVFPCVCIIAIALVWTALIVTWQQRPSAVRDEVDQPPAQ